MSFKTGVKTSGDPTYVGNGIRFATREEAEAYAVDLQWRWASVTSYEVTESNEPVNYVFENGNAYHLDDPRRLK